MSFPYGEEYTPYRWLCRQGAVVRLLAWEPAPGDLYLGPGEGVAAADLAWLGAGAPPAGSHLCPRLDQLKTRVQRRLTTSWRQAQDHFERWMAERGFYETEEEAWLRFLAHLHEVDLPEPPG
ncbi:MAG: hypothetical protein D6739_03375 [Nitrospirae bacterium]|nr:MAG: hypothetical protein D6739_03375 [Nitrospirota bacterium]